MFEPLVACVMPTVSGRAAMAARAAACFYGQTYRRRILIELDTSSSDAPLGALRNRINRMAAERGCDLIAHWDDDDWSERRRLERQVSLWRQTGKAVVGCHSMYFVDQRELDQPVWQYQGDPGYAIGTSLLYEIGFWQRKQFEATPTGSDSAFVRGEDVATADGCVVPLMMVARIHSGSANARAGHRNMQRFEDSRWGPFRCVRDAEIAARAREVFANA